MITIIHLLGEDKTDIYEANEQLVLLKCWQGLKVDQKRKKKPNYTITLSILC